MELAHGRPRMIHLDISNSHSKVALYIKLVTPTPRPSTGSLGWAIVPDERRNVNEHNFKQVMATMRTFDSARGTLEWT